MKKITLLILTLFLALSGYSQGLYQDFEDAAAPTSGTWVIGDQTWLIFDNGVGTQNWTINPPAFPPYQGDVAAFINIQNVGIGNTAVDFLVTPAVELPTNPQLRFWTRTTNPAVYGTLYQIRVAPVATTPDPTDISAYTILEEWDETDLTANYDVYEEKVVPLPYPANTELYIAFVKVWFQNAGGLIGDRWLVDEVRVIGECLTPSNLDVACLSTTASMSWDAQGATQWEVHVLPAGAAFPPAGGTPIVTSDNTDFIVSATTGATPGPLTPLTDYDYYVRAICVDSNGSTSSEWTEAFECTTQAAPPECGGNFVDSGGVSGNYGNNENSTVTICPDNPGDIVTVTFTSFNTEATWDGIYVFDGNSTSDTPILSGNPIGNGPIDWPGAFWGTTIPGPFTSTSADGCLTFWFLSDGSGVRAGWTADVTCNPPPPCPQPTALEVYDVTATEATFEWINVGPATQWEILIQSPADPAPTADDPNWQLVSNPVTITTLLPGTSYVYYVRAVCSPTETSAISGPIAFNTTQIPAVLPYDEDFEVDPQFGISNGTQTNKWIIGTAVSNGGTHSLYITNDNGASNTFTNTSNSVVHAYRDFQMPAALDELNLGFDWRAMAESCCDYIRVWIVPSTFTPTPGTQITAAASGGIQIGGNHNQQSTWQTVNYVVPAAAYAGQVMRLIFEWRNDGSIGAQPPGAIDNVNLHVITCSAPSALAFTNVTQTGADVSWTGPTAGAESYDYYYSTVNTAPDGTTTPTGNVVDPAVILNTLAPSSTYYFWVRTNCGPNGVSTWTGPIMISTTQIPADLNFVEDWEGDNNWSIVGNQTNKWVVGTAVSNGGTHSLYITNDNGASNTYTNNSTSVAHAYRDIQMPAALDDLNLAFDWRAMAESCCDYIRVWFVPTSFFPTAGTQITAAASGGIQIGGNHNQSGSWQTVNYVIPAAAYAGQTMRLVFEWRNDGSVGTQPPGAVDNINLSIITCSAPTALVLDDVTQTGADVSWTGPTSGAESFDYYYSTVNTAPNDSSTINGNVTDPNVNLTGLDPSTVYYFWVRSNCGADGVSTWTGPIMITTTQIPGVLDYVDDFEGDNGWSYVGTQTNKWIVGTAVSNGGTHSLYITNNNGTSNTYTTSATSVAHAYRDIQMPATVGELSFSFDWRAVGEGFATVNFDYFRVWLVPATFVPVAGAQITAGADRIQINGNYNNSNAWQTENYIFQAAAYSGEVLRVVFEWRNDGGGGTQPPAAIDNVSLVALTCPSPVDLTASTTSTLNQLELTWSPTGTETQWEIVVQVAGSGAPVSGTIVNGTPSFLFDAVPGTFYEFFVRAICSPDDTSFWSGPQPFSIFSPPGCASVDLVGVGVDIVDAEIFLCAGESQCVDLSASFYGIGATTSYAVEAIDYDPPFPFTGGIEMPITADDDYTPSFDLPFNFCFFGESYDFCRIGDNGVITFGMPYTTTYGEYCPWTLNGPIPNPTFSVKNSIYGVFQDLYTTNNPGPNTSINYQVLGTYPCRALVVNFNEVPAFGTGCTDPQYRMTTQIVLYEISNIIEVYVQNRTACPNWQNGLGVLGIQNAAGTVAYTPPGRNTGAWNASNEAWRFSPDGESNVEFEWIKDGEFYSSDQDIQVCISEDTHMVAQATYIACDGTEVVTSSEVTIRTTSPLPTNDPLTIFTCSATGNPIFDLSPNTTTILSGVSDPNITVTYYLTEADAIAGTNPITDITTFAGTPGQVIYVRIAYGDTECFEVKSFDLQLGENTPAITTFSYDGPFCRSDTTNPLPIPVTGFTVGGTYSSDDLAVNAATGEIDLANSPAGTYDVIYTVAPNACNEGGSFTTSVTIDAAANADVLPDVSACGVFVLPALSDGNMYYAGPGGTGANYPVGYEVTGSQDIYIYATNASCSDESSFAVTIYPAPQIDPIAPVFACDSYVLPSLAVGEYYTASGGPAAGAVMVPQGTELTDIGETILYVYAEIVTDSNVCFDEQQVTINISTTPVVDPVADVVSCGSFELPAITSAGSYYSGAGGTGTAYAAGDIITESMTMYIYEANGSCSDEESFDITISSPPAFTIEGGCENNVYTLTAVPVDGSYDPSNVEYAWSTTGTGTITGNGPSVTVSADGEYFLTVSVIGNAACASAQSFDAQGTMCMIQKGISVNGDGQNDSFDLTGHNVTNLSIFNRYGSKVYERRNYVNEWFGQSDNGDELPDGTYYYVMEFSGTPSKTGWIYINRAN